MSVFFYGCVTLDGYLADKNHRLDWLHETGGTEDTGYEDFYRQMAITLMGRRTFQEIQGMENPEEIYPTTVNYVFTHGTLEQKGFLPVTGDAKKRTFGSSGETRFWPRCWTPA